MASPSLGLYVIRLIFNYEYADRPPSAMAEASGSAEIPMDVLSDVLKSRVQVLQRVCGVAGLFLNLRGLMAPASQGPEATARPASSRPRISYVWMHPNVHRPRTACGVNEQKLATQWPTPQIC
jgi:hypothetical protein